MPETPAIDAPILTDNAGSFLASSHGSADFARLLNKLPNNGEVWEGAGKSGLTRRFIIEVDIFRMEITYGYYTAEPDCWVYRRDFSVRADGWFRWAATARRLSPPNDKALPQGGKETQ